MENVYLKGKKILIVEDDFASRLYLNKILEKSGATLFTAEDGRTAVDIFRNNRDIELILMDIQLPVMNGYESTAKIRELSKDVIIIAQTAYGLHGDREKILGSGFNDCIVKPFIHHNLLELIVSNLSGARK
jgi:CheY-like chemotaxis protein